MSYPRQKYNVMYRPIQIATYFDSQFSRDVWYTACTLVRKEAAPEKRRKSSRSLFTLPRSRETSVFFSSTTHICVIFFFLYILLSCMRARKRDRAYTPAVWALPRPYRQLSGRDVTQWGRQCAGQYTPLLLETIRPSTPGVPTHLSTVDFSPLLESAHPANLINIIADYAAPRSQWELRVKRYRRYEALALCASLSLSFSVLGCPERIIRRQTCHRGFAIHEKPL